MPWLCSAAARACLAPVQGWFLELGLPAHPSCCWLTFYFLLGAGAMDSFKVVLEGPAPWGFRLQGGKDFNVPLSISRLTPGGKAAQAGVAVGDWVLSIDGENAGGLTHIEAQNKIRACGEHLSLGLSRAQPAQSKLQKVQTPDKQPLRPLVPDASKQRLMEDTEDWRPRPGTSQSRSFRILAHLTGTEFMQDPDEEHLKKSRSCSQVPRTEAPAPASATPQEPWPGPTTLSPTSRPPWAVDPGFAERYAPDKTSTVLTRHSQPATPTPLQNRTSIVQAAAGGGTGAGGGNNGKTPVCHHCHKVIRGRYLVALGHAYHPEEFVCSQCGKVLEEGGFFEEKGAIFCPPCYDVRYAPSCAKCKKKITGLWRGGAKLPGDCTILLGDHACPKDDLARALFHLCGLQDTHSEQGLLHGRRGTVLRARL
uniref:PDZ and LIM domain protein 7 n=1 Tax=Canis lupus dingo TaxID=286419 RepID=A0A8C0KFS7_CANLU